jgi:hypothetical protein
MPIGLAVPREEPGPSRFDCMKDWNRVVGRAVLENNDETTLAAPLWMFPIRDLPIAKQLSTIGPAEMRALVRENIVRLV